MHQIHTIWKSNYNMKIIFLNYKNNSKGYLLKMNWTDSNQIKWNQSNAISWFDSSQFISSSVNALDLLLKFGNMKNVANSIIVFC